MNETPKQFIDAVETAIGRETTAKEKRDLTFKANVGCCINSSVSRYTTKEVFVKTGTGPWWVHEASYEL